MPPRKAKKSTAKELVSTSRFMFLQVKKRISIREFFKANDIEFSKGKGYYQLTKPETIQENKEVVVRRKSDGKIVTGDEVCVDYLHFITSIYEIFYIIIAALSCV